MNKLQQVNFNLLSYLKFPISQKLDCVRYHGLGHLTFSVNAGTFNVEIEMVF